MFARMDSVTVLAIAKNELIGQLTREQVTRV
jgi:hypothetical protein